MVGFTFERRLRVAPRGGAGGWWAGLFPGRNRSLVGGAVSAALAGGWWAGLCRGEAGSGCGRGCAQGWSRRLVGGAVWVRPRPGVEPEGGGRGWARARAPGSCLSWSPLNPSPFCSSGPSRTGKADVAEGAPRSRRAAHLPGGRPGKGRCKCIKALSGSRPAEVSEVVSSVRRRRKRGPALLSCLHWAHRPTEPGPRLRTSVIEAAGCGVAPPVSWGGA